MVFKRLTLGMVQGQIRFSRFSEVSVQRDREKKEMEEGNTPFTGHSEPPKLDFCSEEPCVVASVSTGCSRSLGGHVFYI